MDEFALLASFGPLAIYLLLLGVVLCMRRPFVTTCGRDIAALGLGVSGMIFVGPIQLFFPSMSMASFGMWTWLMLVVFYALALSLVVMNLRPRLIIYGSTIDDTRAALKKAGTKLDPACRQDSDSVYLPTLRLRLRAEVTRGRSCCEVLLVSGSTTQNAWDRLTAELRNALRDATPQGRGSGVMLIAASTVLATLLASLVIRTPGAIVEGFRLFIRLQ